MHSNKINIIEFYEATNSAVATQQKICQHNNVRRFAVIQEY